MIAAPPMPVYVLRLTKKLTAQWTGLSMALFLVSMLVVSKLYYLRYHQPWLTFETVGMSKALLGLTTLSMATIVLHEMIHGSAFRYFGARVRYGLGFKLGLPYVYAAAPGEQFSRNAFFAIALAPLLILNFVALAGLLLFPQASWLSWMVIWNTAWASGDLWMTLILSGYPASVRVEGRKMGIAVYAPPELEVNLR